MLWVLGLHIVALLLWSGMLLYLPALVAETEAQRTEIIGPPARHASVARFVCTHAATPAALVAIISGTAIFLLNATAEPWMLLKLTLVAGLVLCHVVIGFLILRAESHDVPTVRPWCWGVSLVMSVLMAAIVWVVLAKPSLDILPWAP